MNARKESVVDHVQCIKCGYAYISFKDDKRYSCPRCKLSVLPPKDPTNPDYYKKGDFQSFDFILAVCKELPGDHAACVDDVLKYVSRYYQKNGLEDLHKARWYLNKLISIVETEVKNEL